MILVMVLSQNGIPIRLSQTQWQHILIGDPEIETLRVEILDTVTSPDQIQSGDSGELLATRFYALTPLTSKHLVVVYRELSLHDGFILTAYLTRKPSNKRKILWKRLDF